MFEIESKQPEEITIKTATKNIVVNIVESKISAGLNVGEILGPGEFEIGEAAIRGIEVSANRVIYDIEIGGVHIGVIGGIEEGLDELGVADILCTSSVRAVREISPKLVIATGNIDGMVMELKLSAKTEKKIKIKKIDDLPSVMEVVALT